jgi:TetR/AcrR family transcriptional regulator, transcriptional repressor of bet genes
MLAVDHDERKRVIARTANEIIAREGMQAATIRRIAGELNTSTRAVTHYFADKDELLHWVYDFMAAEGYRSFARHLEDNPADLLGCLLTMTPLDHLNRQLWRVYIAFWDLATRDPYVAAGLHQSIADVEELVTKGIKTRNPAHADCLASARHLIALVNGISVQLVIEPGAWTPVHAREVLDRSMEAILGPPTL